MEDALADAGRKTQQNLSPCSPPHSAFTLPGLVLLQACSTFPSYTFISMLLSFWELSSENTHISRTASRLNFTFLLFPPDGCLIHIPWQGQSEAMANVIKSSQVVGGLWEIGVF